ncbi:hypothetical protein F4823DRAFT_568711 [Ustulina deusta]|nr:hypothetical protein F4823DRAFT_568711 [Ustulina deusta]
MTDDVGEETATRLPTGDISRHDHNPGVQLSSLFRKGLLLCMVVYFFHQMQTILPIGLFLRLFERSIYYKYYVDTNPDLIGPGGEIDELLCKVQPVQHALAAVRAVEGFFAAGAVLVAAVPYARLSEYRGKKFVIALSLVGLILSCVWMAVVPTFSMSLSIKWVWLVPAFWLIGGGDLMLSSMVYLIAAGHLAEEQRFEPVTSRCDIY